MSLGKVDLKVDQDKYDGARKYITEGSPKETITHHLSVGEAKVLLLDALSFLDA